MNVRKIAIPALTLVVAYCGHAAADTVHEFTLEDGRAVYPAYRTWDFDIDEPGLYVFDIAPPDAKTRPQVRECLDGTQIAFSHGGNDYSAKTDAQGRLRRFRWLEAGRHTLDLCLHFHSYPWTDEMSKAMGEKGVRATLMRPKDGEAGFWMPDDCMARVAGEPLVVYGCAAKNGSRIDTETRRRFLMEVCFAGEGKPIWSQTLEIDTKPVRFEYPCDREGAFKYIVRDVASGEVVEGPWDFVVTDVKRVLCKCENVANANVANCQSILVDRVDCTEGSGGPHLFREGGKSKVVETPGGAYRLAGPQGYATVYRRKNADGSWSSAKKDEKGAQPKSLHDWFGYTLKVDHPGRSHALVVRVPNDVRHFTSVVAYDRRTRLSNAWSIDLGDAPAAGPWSEMKIPVWPNSDAIDVMVISTDGALNTHVPHPDRRGAVASLALLEYPDGFPPLEEPACGWGRTRDFGWCGEQIDLGPNERTMPPLSDAAAALLQDPVKGAALRFSRPYHDWRDFMLTWERTFELEAWRGGTILLYPVYTYDMVAFQGRAQMLAPQGKDVYAEGCFGVGEARNPFDRDVFALMLQRAQKHGVRLVADFMIQRTYPAIVEAWTRLCGMDGATNGFYLSATADGSPYRPVPCVYAGLPNPAHQVARRIQIEFCREFGRRYGRYKSFAGINHRFWKGWPASFEPWFYDGNTGFDDFTVGEFSKATGLSFAPAGKDEKAFEARKKRIKEEYSREWNAWRAEVCRSLQKEMLAALREGAPQARFYAGTWKDVLSEDSGLSPSVFSGKREFGFGDQRAAILGPGVEINNLDPIHFGNFWVHGKNLPPPTGLCCNSSYRCSPYHLEPAALALADNRLDQLWAGGQWCLPPLDDALREFVRVYRAIPDRNNWSRCGGTNAPVAVWWAKDGDDVLFWAVNRTDTNRRVLLTFDKEPPAMVDCVSGETLRASATLREIKLAPFMPGVYRAKGAAALVSADVPVEAKEVAQIEKDFSFIAAMKLLAADAVEVAQGVGEKYFDPAGLLGRRDGRWTFADLFRPMREAHEAGDLHALRALVADFKTNHRWWFEAFGWPDDFCARRNVGRQPLVGFLLQKKRTEMWFGDTNGVYTASYAEQFPQAKEDFVCAPKGVAIDIYRHGPPGGYRQLELNALFGDGYGDIRVEDADGKLIGVVNASSFADSSQISNVHKSSLNTNTKRSTQLNEEARLETRVLSAPIPNPGHQTHVRLVGTGEKGLAIHRLGFTQLPSRPVREWQVIGPFDKGGGEQDRESYLKAFPPENEPFDANAKYVGMESETVRWKTVTLGPGERVLDIAAATPCDVSRCNAVTYLRTTIRAPRKMPTMIRYVNDYYGAIWLNGKPLVAEMRGPIGQYKSAEVWLEKGENEVLVKTSPGSAGTWYFGASVDDCGELAFGGDVTADIQTKIDAAASRGGGEVVVPSGEHRVTSLWLRSGVTLHLARDARLVASRDCSAYPKVEGGHPAGVVNARGMKDVKIIGEPGSCIDGGNCYNPQGGEGYRGPHAIWIVDSTNVVVRGMSVRDSANYAVSFLRCRDTLVEGFTAEGGHDGIHHDVCDGVRISGCRLETGDDSIAGACCTDVVVSNCVLNSACSPIRYGGRDVLITDCRVTGPAKHPHRWTLTKEEKARGARSSEVKGRRTTGCFYQTYTGDRPIMGFRPGNVVIRNVTVENCERFMVSLSGISGAIWQNGVAIPDVTFENVHATGLAKPSVVAAPADSPLQLTFKNCSFGFRSPQKTAFVVSNVKVLESDVSLERVSGSLFEERTSITYDDIPEFPSWQVEDAATRAIWGLPSLSCGLADMATSHGGACGAVEFPIPDAVQSWEIPEMATNGVKAVWIEGVPWHGKETRFFAYYSLPDGASPGKKVPGIVLVHGGWGTAYHSWVKTWNARGYAAIAMDNCGGIPGEKSHVAEHPRHEWSGPNGWGGFSDENANPEDQWVYHAVECVLRSHTFLRNLPEVDASKIGVTGISWGGFLTSIVCGADPRFAFAAPVYGCGNLRRHSVYAPSIGERWESLWNPVQYARRCRVPTLWCTGTNDHFFPLDSFAETAIASGNPLFSIKLRMAHGHPPSGDPPEIAAFADSIVKGGQKLADRKIVRREWLYTRSGDPVWEKRGFNTSEVTPQDYTIRLENSITEDGLVVSSVPEFQEPKPHELTVSPDGMSPQEALLAIRAAKAKGVWGPWAVRVKPGAYTLKETLRFVSGDSGTPDAPVTWVGGGTNTIFAGGEILRDWRNEGGGVWSAPIPMSPSGESAYFEQLWVNGRRADRARLPDSSSDNPVDGYFRIAAASIQAVTNAEGKVTYVEHVTPSNAAALALMPADEMKWAQMCVVHKWAFSRRIIKAVDPATLVVETHSPKDWDGWRQWNPDETLVFFENVRPAFDAPGEWFYDAKSGRVLYRPLPGEDMTKVQAVVPSSKISRLVEFAGDPDNGEYVHDILFKGITFAYSDSTSEDGGHGPTQSYQLQAARGCDGTITARGVRRILFDGCTVAHTGNYGIRFNDGCMSNTVVNCCLFDLGAGGVWMGAISNYVAKGETLSRRAIVNYTPRSTAFNRIENCIMRHGGLFNPEGTGVAFTHVSDSKVLNCDISDFYYTGISVGFTWGYRGSVAQRNEIAFNRIYDLGKGVMSDMGGVYTLGTSFGTRVHHNVVHGVRAYSYGGWGLYADEGSEGITMDHNICWDTTDGGFHQHYGVGCVIRNNIFAWNRKLGAVRMLRQVVNDIPSSLHFVGNIVVVREGPLVGRGPRGVGGVWASNLWYDYSGHPILDGLGWDAWAACGKEVGGVYADPQFEDPLRNDFRFKPTSPAFAFGFEPWDYNTAGVHHARDRDEEKNRSDRECCRLVSGVDRDRQTGEKSL